MNRLLVTRHAPYDVDPESGQDFLTEQGVEACKKKVSDLLTQNIGHNAILLSSASRRAVLTTRELRQGLGINESYKSRYITAVGIRPSPVQNLHDFAEKVLAGCGIEADGRDVVLIAHGALVDAVGRGTGEGIAQVPDNWVNPQFMPDFAFMAEGGERNLGLWLR